MDNGQPAPAKKLPSRPARDHVTHQMTHVIGDGHGYHGGGGGGQHLSEKKTSIKSPIMPYNKWEAPSGSAASGGGSASGNKSAANDTSPITPRRILTNHSSTRSANDYRQNGNHVTTTDSQVTATPSAIPYCKV